MLRLGIIGSSFLLTASALSLQFILDILTHRKGLHRKFYFDTTPSFLKDSEVFVLSNQYFFGFTAGDADIDAR